jgi:hypothetical protein
MTNSVTPQSDGVIVARSGHEVDMQKDQPRFLGLKRVMLGIATTLASVNIWTGCPVLALWVGSRFVPNSGLSMGAIFVVVAVLGVLVIAMTVALAWLSATYDELTGRPMAARRTSPWLRSMRGEREEFAKKRIGTSTVERIVVISVVAAVITFEVWFFFIAGSPLPN